MTLSKPEEYELRAVQRRLIELIEGAREALLKIEEAIGPLKRYDSPDVSVALLYDQTPIEALELSVRSFNALHDDGVKTVADLVVKSDRDLLWGVPNFGKRSLNEVRNALEIHRAAWFRSRPGGGGPNANGGGSVT